VAHATYICCRNKGTIQWGRGWWQIAAAIAAIHCQCVFCVDKCILQNATGHNKRTSITTHGCGELEEFEREDFYRLKRSQAKQLEAKIAFTELIRTKNMTEEELADYLKRGRPAHPVADVQFDVDVFEYKTLEERLREAYLRRSTRRGNSTEPEKLVPSVKAFLDQVALQADPRTSKASFINLSRRAHQTISSSSSSSSASDTEKS